MLSLIVAMSEKDRVIGLEGDLPWKLSADLKRFKKITTGHTVVMGRKTWESIPAKFRPLPNRKNIVLSRQKGYIDSVPEGVGVCKSLEEALQSYAAVRQTAMADEWGDLFIIGGESVFAEALPHAGRLYLTVVDYEEDGDTFFPVDPSEHFETVSSESVAADEKNTHSSRYMVMDRKVTEGT
jgi:dihydrofolate reductase